MDMPCGYHNIAVTCSGTSIQGALKVDGEKIGRTLSSRNYSVLSNGPVIRFVCQVALSFLFYRAGVYLWTKKTSGVRLLLFFCTFDPWHQPDTSEPTNALKLFCVTTSPEKSDPSFFIFPMEKDREFLETSFCIRNACPRELVGTSTKKWELNAS